MDSLEIKRSAKPSIYNFQKYLLMSNYVSNVAWNFKSKCYLSHSRCSCMFYFNPLASDHSTQQNQCQKRKICFKSLLSRGFQYTMVMEAWRDSWQWEHLRETPHKWTEKQCRQTTNLLLTWPNSTSYTLPPKDSTFFQAVPPSWKTQCSNHVPMGPCAITTGSKSLSIQSDHSCTIIFITLYATLAVSWT